MNANRKEIESLIDSFFYDRYSKWQRTEEDCVMVQWNPEDSDSWTPLKDWKQFKPALSRDRLTAFADYLYSKGFSAGLRSAEAKKALENELQPAVKKAPEKVKPTYVALQTLQRKYGIDAVTLKIILRGKGVEFSADFFREMGRKGHPMSMIRRKDLSSIEETLKRMGYPKQEPLINL